MCERAAIAEWVHIHRKHLHASLRKTVGIAYTRKHLYATTVLYNNRMALPAPIDEDIEDIHHQCIGKRSVPRIGFHNDRPELFT